MSAAGEKIVIAKGRRVTDLICCFFAHAYSIRDLVGHKISITDVERAPAVRFP